MLRSRVRARTSVDMEDNCWQESCGFLTARGGKCGGPRKRNAHFDEDVEEEDSRILDEDDFFNIMDDPFGTEDNQEKVLADQCLPIDSNLSVNCINRAVLVGTSIKPDSNASFRDRRRSTTRWQRVARDGALHCVSKYCIIAIMNAYVY